MKSVEMSSEFMSYRQLHLLVFFSRGVGVFDEVTSLNDVVSIPYLIHAFSPSHKMKYVPHSQFPR